MSVRKLLIGAAVGIAVLSIAEPASAQYRFPGAYRPGPMMIYPAIRGASRLGWEIGRYQSIQRYGRIGDPGRWPGLAPSLGLRR